MTFYFDITNVTGKVQLNSEQFITGHSFTKNTGTFDTGKLN